MTELQAKILEAAARRSVSIKDARLFGVEVSTLRSALSGLRRRKLIYTNGSASRGYWGSGVATYRRVP